MFCRGALSPHPDSEHLGSTILYVCPFSGSLGMVSLGSEVTAVYEVNPGSCVK